MPTRPTKYLDSRFHGRVRVAYPSPARVGTFLLSYYLSYGPKEVEYNFMDGDSVVHLGGCHCKHVRWQVEAPSSVVAWSCNCSDCSMRGNIHFIVPSSKFKLAADSDKFLTTYTFRTHTAKHTFCKICGITSFYFPRSNPDGVAVTVKCVDAGTLAHVEIRYFDGRNWESSYDQTSIASFSKSDNEGQT
ncbi:hypothetical protein C4D60_Mb02t19460 [Musa balbisiana]|uniref:CENP-V/GFA domain-containing protein n=1 Tax=Musa balbisiana TaxID=52838 RepID=A0A4S8IBV1_MUSBA|nr:hypothetical protein C4D60_Mb02t19460 [Musa balbisiana]